jgi:hypothetical protein
MLRAQQEPVAEGQVATASLIRLTKDLAQNLARNLTQNLTRAVTVLALSATGAHAACGQAAGKTTAQEQRATIALQNLDRHGPVYYWHDSSTYALLYFRPEDMIARLESLAASDQGANRDSPFGDASLAPALLDNIKVDLPLKESTDLFRYTLIDQRFDSVVNLVIADLMKEGKVMLDQWVFVEHPAKSIVMVSRANAAGEEAGRWFCTSANDVLFKVGYDAGD